MSHKLRRILGVLRLAKFQHVLYKASSGNWPIYDLRTKHGDFRSPPGMKRGSWESSLHGGFNGNFIYKWGITHGYLVGGLEHVF